MKWELLTTSDSSAWHHALARFAQTDIYFLPEYHHAYEVNGDGTATAFVAHAGEAVLFYPFLLRPVERVGPHPLPTTLYDIETVYGYSGPIATTTDSAFLDDAWACFDGWCAQQGVIAAFMRFNPLLQNWHYAGSRCRVNEDRKTVALNLVCSEEVLWASYPGTQRTKIRKAVKHGLLCEQLDIAAGLPGFRHLYVQTMDHNTASDYYYFSDAYFHTLAQMAGEQVTMFGVWHGTQLIAAAIFLLHHPVIHYHLGASDVTFRESRPNNLLFHTVARWGSQHGFHTLHLGGGRTPAPDDALFRFKASFSDHYLPHYIGQRVQNQAAYEQLCTLWKQWQGVTSPPPYFLLYRLT